MSDSDLAYMPATRALDLFASKKLSPVELVKAVIARHHWPESMRSASMIPTANQSIPKARRCTHTAIMSNTAMNDATPNQPDPSVSGGASA